MLYNPVPQSLAFAKGSNAPIMIVVFNNKGYKSMTENQLSYYPDGAGAKHKIFYGETLDGPDYDELVRPFEPHAPTPCGPRRAWHAGKPRTDASTRGAAARNRRRALALAFMPSIYARH